MLCGRVIHVFCSTGKLALCVVSVDSKNPKNQNQTKNVLLKLGEVCFLAKQRALKDTGLAPTALSKYCVPSSS